MRYALEQIAAGNTKGIAQMASGWNVGLMCGAVLASGKNAAFKDLTKKINTASTETGKPDDKFLDKLFADTNFRPKALMMVADADAISPGAQTAFEGLKGESLLQAGTPSGSDRGCGGRSC